MGVKIRRVANFAEKKRYVNLSSGEISQTVLIFIIIIYTTLVGVDMVIVWCECVVSGRITTNLENYPQRAPQGTDNYQAALFLSLVFEFQM